MKATPIQFEPGLGIWSDLAMMKACVEFDKWYGTPWKNRMAKRGVGIDCLNLVRELYVAAGMLPKFALPYYHYAIGIREEFNVMESFLEICCDVEIITAGGIATDGDAVLFKCGDTTNHIGMILSGRLLHSRANLGCKSEKVEFTDFTEIQSFVRLVKPGFRRRPETITRQEVRGKIIELRG